MRSREESSLKTDALRYLADALSEDIAATPEPKILAEERDDSAQRPPLALAFEELLADAKALARKRGTVPGISRADTPVAETGAPPETTNSTDDSSRAAAWGVSTGATSTGGGTASTVTP